MQTTIEKLDRLADMIAQTDVLKMHFDKLRKSVITPEIQAALDEIAEEEKTALDAMSAGIDSLTAEIKAEVSTAGTSIKGANLHAVYAKGRVSWDSKRLDGYAAAHPEIIEFRKEGAPSVSIRAAK